MRKDHHAKPFDEGTKLKLEVFKNYLRKWLPIFLKMGMGTINVFDLYCGPGKDILGVKGSPLIALDVVSVFHDEIIKSNCSIRIIFNDIDKDKTDQLSEIIPSYDKVSVSVIIENKEVADIFYKYLPDMKKSGVANFLFFDPCGLPDHEALKEIFKLKYTDFLLFVPAEFIHRFKSTREFSNKWPGINELITNSPEETPRAFSDWMRARYNLNQYYLAHFGIKKPTGKTHGLVFGSHSIRGLEKFVEVCWEKDPLNGEASFALKGDIRVEFEGYSLLPGITETGRKLKDFERSLAKDILDRKIQTNHQCYLAAVNAACLPKHARGVIRALQGNGKIKKGIIPISWEAFKKPVVSIDLV